IVHLDRVEERRGRLLDEVGGAAVPELSALGLRRLLAVVDVLGEAEGGAVGLVHDRRNLAPSDLVRRAAGGDAGDGRSIVPLEGVFGRMARGAGEAARLGKVGVLEHPLAEELKVGEPLLVRRGKGRARGGRPGRGRRQADRERDVKEGEDAASAHGEPLETRRAQSPPPLRNYSSRGSLTTRRGADWNAFNLEELQFGRIPNRAARAAPGFCA